MATYNGFPVTPLPVINSTITGLPIAARSLEYGFEDTEGVNTNPFTQQQQIYDWGASLLEVSVSYPLLRNFQANLLEAWLMATKGCLGVFAWGDPLNIGPQNPSATAPTVNGSGQTGYSLNYSGGGGQMVGDWISIPGTGGLSTGNRLYRITSLAIGTFGIWPQIRESPAGGTSIIIANPTGMFRLKGNSRKASVSVNRTTAITFEIREAI